MSVELSSTDPRGARALTAPERELLASLLQAAGEDAGLQLRMENLVAEPMADGGMGSLRLRDKGETRSSRRFGRRISEIQFLDADGVAVIASLNVDERGELYELDVWKTDFSPTVRLKAC